MRKIQLKEILLALTLPTMSALLTVALFLLLPDWSFNFQSLIIGMSLFYFFECSLFKIFLKYFPLSSGVIKNNSKEQTIYHIYILQYLMFLYPLTFNKVIPTPIRRWLFIFLGAQLGENTYTSGVIFDPTLVTVGSNSILGFNSLIIPHEIEANHLAHYPIQIGNNVTVGANAIIHSGCIIYDGAIIASGAVLAKGSVVGSNEVWGGVPARKIKSVIPSNVSISSSASALTLSDKHKSECLSIQIPD